jgi:hypothetical protein
MALAGLRWVLGVIVLLESVRFALSAPGHEFGKTGLPLWLPPLLGGSEAIAALLFLAPAATLVGGYALVFIFTIAIGIHFLHGQWDAGSLVIYGMAVIVCITRTTKAEAPHDR